jgi:putative heme degradation protein
MDFSRFATLSTAQWIGMALVIAIEIFLFTTLFILWKKSTAFQKKLDIFFGGKDGKALEEVLIKQKEDMKTFDKEIQELFEISNRLYKLGLQSQSVAKPLKTAQPQC